VAVAYRLGELAERIGGRVSGDPDRAIRGLATLEQAEPTDLSFLTNPRYRGAAATTRAGALLVAPGQQLPGRDLLVVAAPYRALAELLELFHPQSPPPPGISEDARVGRRCRVGRAVHVGPFAVLEDEVELADEVVIGAGCVIGAGSRIGAASVLHPRVVLYPRTEVGARCLLHSGVVLGGDGFGFATHEGDHVKIPQVGRVVVEDDVEIGANATVDRAMLGETRIGAGTKIDDLVMIAHGVRIGPRALLAAQSGIAGSARLGARVVLAGQSGVAGHLDLGDGVVVAAKSAVLDDQPDGARIAGVPAFDLRRWKRAAIAWKDLPELGREIRELRARIEALERERDAAGED
jgi:UDP-3-O-[3-hydroxymyristoyl] glucosamine N-acyltransferase